jgi:hypothetical protein
VGWLTVCFTLHKLEDYTRELMLHHFLAAAAAAALLSLPSIWLIYVMFLKMPTITCIDMQFCYCH